jgi:hypothetical protein
MNKFHHMNNLEEAILCSQHFAQELCGEKDQGSLSNQHLEVILKQPCIVVVLLQGQDL